MRKTSNYKWAVILPGLMTAVGIIVWVFSSYGFDRPLPYFTSLAVVIGVSLGFWGLSYQLRKDKKTNRV